MTGLRASALLLMVLMLAACGNVVESTFIEVGSEVPSATMAPTPTAIPTAIAPSDAVIESFGVFGDTLAVLIKNPNTDYGLARARFSLAAIAEDGSVIAVFGTVGVPGSLSSTIYQLPPQGEFTYVGFNMPGAAPVASVELSVVDPWIPWDTVDPIIPTLSGLSLAPQFGYVTLRGRVSNPGTVTVNIWVGAVYDDSGALSVLAGVVECVKAGEDRAFEILGQAPASATVSLTRGIAYPTTVDPSGSTQFC